MAELFDLMAVFADPGLGQAFADHAMVAAVVVAVVMAVVVALR